MLSPCLVAFISRPVAPTLSTSTNHLNSSFSICLQGLLILSTRLNQDLIDLIHSFNNQHEVLLNPCYPGSCHQRSRVASSRKRHMAGEEDPRNAYQLIDQVRIHRHPHRLLFAAQAGDHHCQRLQLPACQPYRSELQLNSQRPLLK
jgi:hypothetical protein